MVSKMEIVFEKETSRPGNDCLIEECYTVLEMFDRYLALHVAHFSGWMGDDYSREQEFCNSKQKAMSCLKKWGLED